jgi:hypothetical protein
MTTNGKVPRKGPKPELIKKWRAELPEITHLVEEVAPRMFQDNRDDRRATMVPEEWKQLVVTMRKRVHEKRDNSAFTDESEESIAERLGSRWSWEIDRVSDMIEYLCEEILHDIGIDDGATLGSMILVRKAFLALLIELQDGGTKHGRDDGEEYQFRVLGALKALTPRFDDISFRRFRALARAEISSAWSRPLMSDAELDKRVEEMSHLAPETEPDRQRDWFTVTQPVMSGVQARAWLAEVDERFASLDPLECYEEFADAFNSTKGGKVDGGDGRIGPARALARLAIRCGALEFEQGADEDFDTAVERARGNLLVTRSRIRKTLRSFPGRRADEPLDDD